MHAAVAAAIHLVGLRALFDEQLRRLQVPGPHGIPQRRNALAVLVVHGHVTVALLPLQKLHHKPVVAILRHLVEGVSLRLQALEARFLTVSRPKASCFELPSAGSIAETSRLSHERAQKRRGCHLIRALLDREADVHHQGLVRVAHGSLGAVLAQVLEDFTQLFIQLQALDKLLQAVASSLSVDLGKNVEKRYTAGVQWYIIMVYYMII